MLQAANTDLSNPCTIVSVKIYYFLYKIMQSIIASISKSQLKLVCGFFPPSALMG